MENLTMLRDVIPWIVLPVSVFLTGIPRLMFMEKANYKYELDILRIAASAVLFLTFLFFKIFKLNNQILISRLLAFYLVLVILLELEVTNFFKNNSTTAIYSIVHVSSLQTLVPFSVLRSIESFAAIMIVQIHAVCRIISLEERNDLDFFNNLIWVLVVFTGSLINVIKIRDNCLRNKYNSISTLTLEKLIKEHISKPIAVIERFGSDNLNVLFSNNAAEDLFRTKKGPEILDSLRSLRFLSSQNVKNNEMGPTETCKNLSDILCRSGQTLENDKSKYIVHTNCSSTQRDRHHTVKVNSEGLSSDDMKLIKQSIEKLTLLPITWEKKESSLLIIDTKTTKKKQSACEREKVYQKLLLKIYPSINIIINSLDSIKMELLSAKDELNLKKIRLCERSLGLLNCNINNIIGYCKIKLDHAEWETRTLDFASLVKELNFLVKFRAKLKDINFRIHIDPCFGSSIGINCDIEKIKQVLLNLLENSLKFTSKGGTIILRIDYELAPSNIDRDKIPSVRFNIEDSGLGILQVDIPHLFKNHGKHFPPPNNEIKTGLLISQKILKKLLPQSLIPNGLLKVKCQEGGGSNFSFLIPLDGCNSTIESSI